MRLIHFSDTHLGFNDLGIINEQGIDVVRTGTLFHHLYPSHFTFRKSVLSTSYAQNLANLVLRIAFSKTLSELSGASSVGFLAFDEVFGSQDENRRMEILEAFHTIKEQYRQIFLISHAMEIKEMFERVVEF